MKTQYKVLIPDRSGNTVNYKEIEVGPTLRVMLPTGAVEVILYDEYADGCLNIRSIEDGLVVYPRVSNVVGINVGRATLEGEDNDDKS